MISGIPGTLNDSADWSSARDTLGLEHARHSWPWSATSQVSYKPVWLGPGVLMGNHLIGLM